MKKSSLGARLQNKHPAELPRVSIPANKNEEAPSADTILGLSHTNLLKARSSTAILHIPQSTIQGEHYYPDELHDCARTSPGPQRRRHRPDSPRKTVFVTPLGKRGAHGVGDCFRKKKRKGRIMKILLHATCVGSGESGSVKGCWPR